MFERQLAWPKQVAALQVATKSFAAAEPFEPAAEQLSVAAESMLVAVTQHLVGCRAEPEPRSAAEQSVFQSAVAKQRWESPALSRFDAWTGRQLGWQIRQIAK